MKIKFVIGLLLCGLGTSSYAQADALRLETADGAWSLRAVFLDESGRVSAATELASNVLYRVRAEVTPQKGTPCPSRMQFDAAMPSHYHGMPTKAKVISAACAFQVSGVYFQMKGPWELYFDIVLEGTTSRAVFATNLQK